MAADSGEPTGSEGKPDNPLSFNSLIKKGLIGAGVVIGLILALAFIFRDEDSSPPSTVPTADAATTTSPPLGPEVAPINICALIEFDEAEEALGLAADEGFFSVGAGEACEWRTESERALLRIGPAAQNRFSPGATVDDATAVEVSGIGGAAIWFAGPESGTLSTATETDIGILLVEVTLRRPDLDDASRRTIATDVMTTAIERIRFGPPPPIDVDLCVLVSDQDAEALLAPHRQGRPGARDELVVSDDFAETVDLSEEDADASCKKLTSTEIYVSATTSTPTDFGSTAEIDGVNGQMLEDLGDEAMLFENVPTQTSFSAPHETDIVAVRTGRATFRIVTALPDLAPAEQVATTRRLARVALERVSNEGVEVVTIDRPEPDISRNGLLGNLLVKEEKGDWDRGEGLVASLSLIVGEAEREEVLVHPDIELEETTSVVRLAYEYLENGEDEDSKAELTELLGRMFFTDEQLEGMAGNGEPTASLDDLWAAAASPEDCSLFYTGWSVPEGVGVCLERRTIPGLPGYKVFGPTAPFETGGWEEKHFNWVVEALNEAVPHFKTLGTLPPVNIVLSATKDSEGAYASAAPRSDSFPNRPCGVTVFTEIREIEADPKDFKQVIAHELAHCFHGDTLREESEGTNVAWWDEGLAEYWSNTVPAYVSNNLEHGRVPVFDGAELATTVFHRSYTNFIFFQHLANKIGHKEVLDAIRSLPDGTATTEAQRDALGNFPGMANTYHDFVKQLTDVNVIDTDETAIPNDPKATTQAWDKPMIVIDYPPPFGVSRFEVSVPTGKVACLSHEVSSHVQLSWRDGARGKTSNTWTSGLPDVLSGKAVIVATSVKPDGVLTVDVDDVVADEEECDEEDQNTDNPGSDPGNAGLDCFDLCGISEYYRYPEAVQSWVLDMMPPLSDPVEP